MCLLHGLAKGKGSLDLNSVAQHYNFWIKSKPFDIGGTIRNALFKSGAGPASCKKAALKKADSCSNGGLMRVSPIAVWGYQLSNEEIATAVKEEQSLTHANSLAQEASASYCIAISNLVKGLSP